MASKKPVSNDKETVNNEQKTETKDTLKKETEKYTKEIEALKKDLSDKEKSLEEQKQQYLRLYAEFDNFKKRSIKEKQQTYTDAKADALSAFLPVIDNIERAVSSDGDAEDIKKGVELIMKQVSEVMAANDISEIEAMGKTFDPNIHNAVMHIDDESFGEQEICDVFQKGYKIGEKVVRHSVVKVAN